MRSTQSKGMHWSGNDVCMMMRAQMKRPEAECERGGTTLGTLSCDLGAFDGIFVAHTIAQILVHKLLFQLAIPLGVVAVLGERW